MKKLLPILSILLMLCADLHADPQYTGTDGKHRVLAEAFTSDGWCGYCPRSHALMKNFDKTHGDDVVRLYYMYGRSGGYCFIKEADSYFNVQGFPSLFINRVVDNYGVSIAKQDVETVYANKIDSIARIPGPDFRAYAALTDDKVNFDVRFDENIAANGYKVTCLVLADGITTRQSNYYSGHAGDFPDSIEEMDYYFAQSKDFEETLDRVAVAASDLNGMPVESDEVSVELALPNLSRWNITGYHGVIILTDSGNNVVNVLSVPVEQKVNVGITIVENTEEGISLYSGSSSNLHIIISPESMGGEPLTWSSDNEEVVRVDAEGMVTAVAPGEAVVTVALASKPEVSASIRITVLTPCIQMMEISPDYVELTSQDTYQLTAYCQGIDGWEKYDRINWSSSDESVATVDQNGLVTAISPGYAEIHVLSEISNVGAVARVVVNERIPDYKVSLPEKTAYRTAVYWLPVEISNKADMLGLQCDVHIGEGCEFAVDGDRYKVEMNAGRAWSHSAVSSILEDGSLRVLCTSPENQPIYSGEGEILYVPVRIAADAPDKISFSISGVVISKIDSSSEKIEGCEVEVPVEDMIVGDLDGDGEINVADVTGIISVVMGNQGFNLTSEAADYNQDGVVDVMDVVNMIDAILHPAKSPGKVKKVEGSDSDEPMSPLNMIPSTYVRGESTTLEIDLNEPQRYIAAQFDIELPAHSYFLTDDNGKPDVTLESGVAPAHLISAERIDGNACRVVIYSLSNATFSEGSRFVNVGVGFDQDVEDEVVVSLKNIRLVTSDRQSVNVDSSDCTLTEKNVSVENVEADDVRISVRSGEIRISGISDEESVRLYTVDGSLIGLKDAINGECRFEVPAGIYIIRVGDNSVKVIAD